ncbi:MAG: C45 family peptidase, partial [Candidatus Bipolaricaulota bacterium]
MSSKRLNIVEISGTPFDRGKEYGSKLKERIGEFVEYLIKEFQEKEGSEQDLLTHSEKYLPFIKNYSKPIYQEMKGIAEGSGRSIEEVAMVSLHEERRSFSELAQNCTAFAVTGEGTKDGSNLMGQTWDITPGLCENADPFLLKVGRESGPSFLSYTYPGMMAGAGLNTEGIGISWNSVPRLGFDYGVPTYVIIENVLRQEKIGDALSVVLQAKRAGCFNFVIGGEEEIYSVEATPEDSAVIYSRKTLGHANHYVTERFRNEQDFDEACGRSSASSLVRHNRINRLMEENFGEIDLNLLKKFTQDHVNFPQSICRHPEPLDEDEQGYISCATWIMDNTNKDWWIANGPACEAEFIKYSV